MALSKDLNDATLALATLVLAIATIALARYTRVLSRLTSDLVALEKKRDERAEKEQRR